VLRVDVGRGRGTRKTTIHVRNRLFSGFRWCPIGIALADVYEANQFRKAIEEGKKRYGGSPS